MSANVEYVKFAAVNTRSVENRKQFELQDTTKDMLENRSEENTMVGKQ